MYEYIEKYDKEPKFIRLEDKSMYDFLVAKCTKYLIRHNETTFPTSIFGMKIKVGE